MVCRERSRVSRCSVWSGSGVEASEQEQEMSFYLRTASVSAQKLRESLVGVHPFPSPLQNSKGDPSHRWIQRRTETRHVQS